MIDDSMFDELTVRSHRTVDLDPFHHGSFIQPIGEEVVVPDEILPREGTSFRKHLNPCGRIKIGHDHRKESLVVTQLAKAEFVLSLHFKLQTHL
jgi:hypothetical protein